MAELAGLAVALLLCSRSVLAWGGLGHETICELAFRELDNTARQRVIALIRQDPEFTTFRALCNWPDRPRQRATEHFVNLPRDASGLDADECPMADECVVSAIDRDFGVLASPDTTDEEKLAALAGLSAIRSTLQTQTWKMMANHAAEHAFSREGAILAVRGLARQLGFNLTKRKALQAIPVMGALVGASVNAWYIRDVAISARRAYQLRWLQESGKLV